MYECATTFDLPSQSPAVTAPPKGEPRRVSTEAALVRPCLSLRERWQCRKALTERAFVALRVSHPPSPLPQGRGEIMLKVRRTFGAPSQSPAVTAPPEGEPRHVPTEAALERPCLSLRERWQRAALTERGNAGRPEAVPYIRAIGGLCVGGGVSLARRLIQRAVSRRVGDAPPYITQICIGAPLPLPSGEVAMP